MTTTVEYVVLKSEPLVPTWEEDDWDLLAQQDSSLLFGDQELMIGSAISDAVHNASVEFVEPNGEQSLSAHSSSLFYDNNNNNKNPTLIPSSPTTEFQQLQPLLTTAPVFDKQFSFSDTNSSSTQQPLNATATAIDGNEWFEQSTDILSICTEVLTEDVREHEKRQTYAGPTQLDILRDIRSTAAAFEESRSRSISECSDDGNEDVSQADCVNWLYEHSSGSEQASSVDPDEINDPTWQPDADMEVELDHSVVVNSKRSSSKVHTMAPVKSKTETWSKERRERKRLQNRRAASRYRVKKRNLHEELCDQLEIECERNTKLRSQVEDAEYEISYLKKLILQVQQAKSGLVA